MVDAQQAGVAAGVADLRGEGPVALRAVALRVRGREAPVLSRRVEVVRRRPDAGPRGEEILLRPGVGAVPVHGQRQVVVVPEGEAGLARVAVELAELLVELPLHVLPEEDLLPPLFEKGARVGPLGAAEPLRPEAPRPAALAGRDQVGVDRLEQGELLEGLTLPSEVILEPLAPRAVAGAVPAAGEELREEGAQHAQLEPVRLVVGDVRRRAQAGEQRGGGGQPAAARRRWRRTPVSPRARGTGG